MNRLYAHMFLYPLREQVRICVERKINCLVSLTASILMNLGEEEMGILRSARNNIVIAYHAPPHDMFPGSIDPHIRFVAKQRLSETLNLARKTGAAFIVAHINYLEKMHKYHMKSWIENCFELFDNLLHEYKIPIHLENAYERSPEIFHKILREVDNELLRFTLDVGHIIAYSKVSLRDWILTLSNYIDEIHMHETKAGADEHLPVGSGLVDWDEIIALLEDSGVDIRRIYITVEPRNINDLDRSIQYIKENLGIL